MVNCYILFVMTGYEDEVVRKIGYHFEPNILTPFIPHFEYYHRYIDKRIEIKSKPVFPGYVFIESQLDSDAFKRRIVNFLYKNKNTLRLLDYGDKSDITLRDNEHEILHKLYGDDRRIDCSLGYIEGGHVVVTKGSLIGREALIKKINRHRREAVIEIELMGRFIPVTVGLEIVKKI